MARTAAALVPSAPPGEAAEIVRYLKAVRASAGPNAHVMLLGLSDLETAALQKKVEQGFAFTVVSRILRLMALPMQVLADILQIPPRTLQRRKSAGRLEPDESDRLLRLTRIYGKAIELFNGDNRAALEWLHAPAPALGRKTPFSMLKAEPGSLEVERLISRLEHGVFS